MVEVAFRRFDHNPDEDPMTKSNMDLSELLAKPDQRDFLPGIAEAALPLIIEANDDGLIGAGRHDRSGDRTT
jgi:hypothetical protein